MSDSATARKIPADPTGEPRPEPLRFFGTTWVEHARGYRLRRAAVTVGSLAGAAAGGLALRYSIEGLARIGEVVMTVMIAAFAICSVIGFRRTWLSFTRSAPPADHPDAVPTSNGLHALGFVGTLLAYFVRSFTEAPGEGLRRAEYEAARVDWARRRAARSGNPAADPSAF